MRRRFLFIVFLCFTVIVHASNLFENSLFTEWSTKLVWPANGSAAVTLPYPSGWSFEANGDADGVTKWGDVIFTHSPYHVNESDVIEIKGYATAYDQTLYQDLQLDSGGYLFSASFRGGELSATTHVYMILRSVETGKIIYSGDISEHSGYNDNSFTSLSAMVEVPDSGTYRAGIRAVNVDSECWVQVGELFLEKRQESEPVISCVANRNGFNYIEYKGMPRLLYGIEARIDDYLGAYNPYGNAAKLKTIYQYFQKTAEAGFREIAIPVPWYWIERNEGQFDFSLVDTLVTNAERYHLKIQLIWFGSNVCGWSNVPNYIDNNTTMYPRYPVEGSPLDLSHENLISRESRAFTRLLDFLAQRDHTNVVYMIQLENEPDHKGATPQLWAGGQKSAALNTINMLGQIVHNSPLKMVTRVNFTGWTTSADEMKDYPGVDIIGRDVYSDVLDSFLSSSSYFDYAWNVNHTPENGAQYKNIINLALSAFERGNGYIHYELRTTDWRTSEYDLGLYRSTSGNGWIERDGTQMVPYSLSKTDPDIEVDMQEVKAFHEMIYKADKQIASSPSANNAAFNLDDISGLVIETKSFGDYRATYTSPVGGEAFAMQASDGSAILMSLKDNSSFAFSTLPPSSVASIGYFDEENEWVETSVRTIANNTVVLNAKEVARILPKEDTHLTILQKDSCESDALWIRVEGQNLVIESFVNHLRLQIYTMNGLNVRSVDVGMGQTRIDVSSFKNQILLVRAIDDMGNCYSSKIRL